jgi:diadenosine tetraphosphate (Ap4A) HIT family hydrolase
MFKDEECLFCNKEFKNNKMAGLPETESIIYQDKDLYIIVDIGPLGRGHILIVPNKHVYNFNQLSLQEKIKVDCIKKSIVAIFRNIYSKNTMFLNRVQRNIIWDFVYRKRN